jgi:hypothetical protein
MDLVAVKKFKLFLYGNNYGCKICRAGYFHSESCVILALATATAAATSSAAAPSP